MPEGKYPYMCHALHACLQIFVLQTWQILHALHAVPRPKISHTADRGSIGYRKVILLAVMLDLGCIRVEEVNKYSDSNLLSLHLSKCPLQLSNLRGDVFLSDFYNDLWIRRKLLLCEAADTFVSKARFT